MKRTESSRSSPSPFLGTAAVRVTKAMLGIRTRKSILYLDQHFFSSAYRGKDPQWKTAMQRITELLDLQLVAVPYSSTHEAETEFYTHRDGLLRFIQGAARGHHFEPYYRVEKRQVLKAFQASLANGHAMYKREERDALPSSVHDWDGPYSVNVFRAASGVARKRGYKQRATEELVRTLSDWATSTNTFEQDMQLELRDSARLLMESYDKKAARLQAGDFSALLDSPIEGHVVHSFRKRDDGGRRASHTFVLRVQTLRRRAVSTIVRSAFQHV